jgi:hypothetical protein
MKKKSQEVLSVKKVVESPKKTTPAKKSTSKEVKKTTPKDDKKESKDKKAKKDKVEEKVEKPVKAINVKPTIADECGLNLSVAKVKNILSNKCINKETFDAIKEMKDARVMHECENENEKVKEFTFEFGDLTESTQAYLQECQKNLIEELEASFSKTVISKLPADEVKRYNDDKKNATMKFAQEQKFSNLFADEEFDLTAYNKEYKADFYKKMDKLDGTLTSLKNEALYKYCNDLVIKNNIRFNSETRIFVTAFVEYIFKQLVINGTKNCVKNGKKIIQLEHSLNTIKHEITMFPFIANLNVYKKFLKESGVKPEETSDEDVEDDADDEEEKEEVKAFDWNADDELLDEKTLQFKYYVGELCRGSRMELSDADTSVESPLESKFNQTSVSKNFKQFCSDGIIELLHIFGNFLKVEVNTRGVKTVNYAINEALVRNAHILYNLDATNTIAFIQEKYNIHTKFITDRKLARG